MHETLLPPQPEQNGINQRVMTLFAEFNLVDQDQQEVIATQIAELMRDVQVHEAISLVFKNLSEATTYEDVEAFLHLLIDLQREHFQSRQR